MSGAQGGGRIETACARRWSIAVGTVVLLVATLVAGPLSGAQEPSTTQADTSNEESAPPPLEISSVTPWVSADGEFQVRFKPSTSIPSDARLTYTIHQSMVADSRSSLRDQVRKIIEGGSTGKILQAPITEPFSAYGDPVAGVQVSIPVRSQSSSDRTRVFLPNAGIHPVDMVLTSADGPELWSQVVFLNRLPEGYDPSQAAPASSQQVTVSLVTPIQTTAALDARGTPAFSIEDTAALEATGSLLSSVPGVPLHLGLRPDTLQGVLDTREPWSDSLLASLGVATGELASPGGDGGGSSLLRLPYANVDTTALIQSGGESAMRAQLALGGQVLTAISNTQPGSTTWAMDDSVTSAALPFIKSAGFDSIVVPSSRLDRSNRVTEDDLVTGASQLLGGGGIRVMAYDPLLSQQLTDRTVDPAIRAHQAVAVMMSEWFTDEGSRGPSRAPGSVILVPPTVDPATIVALDAALGGDGPVRHSTGPSMLPPRTGRDTEPSVSLAAREAPDMSIFLGAYDETARQIAALDSMAKGAEPALAGWLHLNAETLSAAMSTDERLARHDTVRAGIASKVGAVVPPPGRRVLLAGRSTKIPLRFKNDLPYDVHLILSARSPRLDIKGGSQREVVLAPGENLIDLPVEVRAPGESLLRLRLTSPDGGLEVANLEIPVQATAISGVGAALSGVSLLFLLLWWIGTRRRRRRQDALEATQHPVMVTASDSEPLDPTNPASTGSVGDGG